MEVPAEGWLGLLYLQIVELKQLPLRQYERGSSWFPSILVFLCLGSIWVEELSSFPFPVQFPSLLHPQDWRGCRSLMFPPGYFFFYITSFLDPHDCSYWISVVARGCAAVTVFLAVLCALVACVVELGIARGSAHADISGSRHEKTILRLWRSWERQRQRITAGPGRMRAVVLGRSCLFGYGSVWLRGKWERGDARFLLVPFSQLPFFLYLSIHSCSEQALALKLTPVAFTWQFLKAALNLSNCVVRSSSHPKYGLWGVGGGFPRQLLCFWCKMKALSLFARNFGAALTISDLKKARSLWQHHKWVLKQNTKYGTRSASLFCLHVLGGRLCRQSLIFWRAESSIPHWKKWVIWDTC